MKTTTINMKISATVIIYLATLASAQAAKSKKSAKTTPAPVTAAPVVSGKSTKSSKNSKATPAPVPATSAPFKAPSQSPFSIEDEPGEPTVAPSLGSTSSPSTSPVTSSPTNAPTIDQLYDVNPPNCTNESDLQGIAIFSGKADDGNGTGIATLTLIDGAENLDLTVVAFTNGNRSVSLFLYLAVPIKHLGLLINPKIFCHDATLGDI